MQAKDHQVFSGKKEFNTEDVKIGQRKARNLDVIEDQEPMIALADGLDDNKEQYMAELAFMEEPVTIRINPAQEKFPAKVAQCWCNGKGAEVFINGKWMQNGWLPIGVPVTTRRKYVEILARSKSESIATRVVKHEQSEENFADRFASMRYQFSVIQDANPRGHDWLSTILMEQ